MKNRHLQGILPKAGIQNSLAELSPENAYSSLLNTATDNSVYQKWRQLYCGYLESGKFFFFLCQVSDLQETLK